MKNNPTLWMPRAYQKKAVQWLVIRPEAALFLDPGLGKTSIALKAFQAMRKAKVARNALVIAPKRVCYMVWSHEHNGELAKWKDSFGDLKVSLLHGPGKEDAVEAEADLYVINFAGLAWLIENGFLAYLMKHRGADTLIVDELSKLKHPKTKRFKMLKPYLKKFKRRYGLTGSPAPNGLIDLFGQVYVVDHGKALGNFVTHYRHKYFLPSGYGGYTWKLQEGAEKRIYAALKNTALSMRARDHLDLPKLVVQDLHVDLPKKARKIYNDLEDQFISEINAGQCVTAANAAVASAKCRQVASGGVYEDQAGDIDIHRPRSGVRKWYAIHDEKTQALGELVDELQGSPMIIGYEFHHDLDRIRESLGDVPALNGKTSDRDSARFINQWNAGDLPILCGHPASMAHGLNLQESGGHICWYSLTWNFEYYDQLIRRVWRQGSKAKRVVVHRILARDTVDELVASVIMKKDRRQDSLMKALQQFAKGRKR